MFVVLCDVAGVVLWTSHTLNGEDPDLYTGDPVWNFVCEEHRLEMQSAILATQQGKTVEVLSSSIVAGNHDWYLTVWAPTRMRGTKVASFGRFVWLQKEFGNTTAKQRDVLLSIGATLTPQEAAERSEVSVNTLRSHLKAIAARWGFSGAAEVQAWAKRYCWIPTQ